MNLLQWDRTKASGYLDRGAPEQAKVQQNSLRKALQLTPDTDSPWEKVQYQSGLEGQDHSNRAQCCTEGGHSRYQK